MDAGRPAGTGPLPRTLSYSSSSSSAISSSRRTESSIEVGGAERRGVLRAGCAVFARSGHDGCRLKKDEFFLEMGCSFLVKYYVYDGDFSVTCKERSIIASGRRPTPTLGSIPAPNLSRLAQ